MILYIDELVRDKLNNITITNNKQTITGGITEQKHTLIFFSVFYF